jgi:hypothetical protein
LRVFWAISPNLRLALGAAGKRLVVSAVMGLSAAIHVLGGSVARCFMLYTRSLVVNMASFRVTDYWVT